MVYHKLFMAYHILFMVYHILYMVYHILFMVLPACASRWDATIIIIISTMIVKDQDQSSGWQDSEQAWQPYQSS